MKLLMSFSKHQLAFLALVRAGLWEKEVRLLPFDGFSFSDLYQLAEEQSVVGLLTAGLEKIDTVNVPQEDVLILVGEALQLEQRNLAMNKFIADLNTNLIKKGVNVVVVKGQGVAQCYERPLWRTSGDIDLIVKETEYQNAKSVMMQMATSVIDEEVAKLHLGMNFGPWIVELQGSLRSMRLPRKLDDIVESVHKNVFENGEIRIWKNNNAEIPLPSPDNDVIFVFAHILKHFFVGGIGLRQVCDWCRLLWTYRETIDKKLLESRIQKMGVMTEWKAFASLAVDLLGMPEEAMPFYSCASKWQRKARRIMSYIFRTGNFGQNRDSSYHQKYPLLISKFISLWRLTIDIVDHSLLFPFDSLKIFKRSLVYGVKIVNG